MDWFARASGLRSPSWANRASFNSARSCAPAIASSAAATAASTDSGANKFSSRPSVVEPCFDILAFLNIHCCQAVYAPVWQFMPRVLLPARDAVPGRKHKDTARPPSPNLVTAQRRELECARWHRRVLKHRRLSRVPRFQIATRLMAANSAALEHGLVHLGAGLGHTGRHPWHLRLACRRPLSSRSNWPDPHL